MRPTLLISTALLLLCVGACASDRSALPTWMEGRWCTAPGQEQSCEQWSAGNESLVGSWHTTRGGQTINNESMRIAVANGRLTFFASPVGAAETPFIAVANNGHEVIFENAAHDYPQRIRYWREGSILKARTSLLDDSNEQEWSFAPTGG